MTHSLTATEQSRLVAFANLAPSVHNTQPTRWYFEQDGHIWILFDPSRHLRIADPTGRDAGLSCGAALEATILGLSMFGIEATTVDILWNTGEESPVPDTVPAARLALRRGGQCLHLADQVQQRFTWRRMFLPAGDEAARALAVWAPKRTDLKLVTERREIAGLAGFNDRASLTFLRTPGYRAELLSWMRLSRSDPRWDIDGLNANALGMTGFEALGASFVLRTSIFEALDRVGLAASIVSERAKTRSATGIGLFHRPVDEPPVATGRAYLTLLLNLARLGFQTWPMAVIADDPEISAEVCRRYSVPDTDRLVNVLRIGAVPPGASPMRARIAAVRLISSQQL